MELSEEDWKIVEARLQQDIDNGKGDEIVMMTLDKDSQSNEEVN